MYNAMILLSLIYFTITSAFGGQTAERNLEADLIEGVAHYKNLVRNGGFEKNSRGWATYDDGAVSIPVDMTGGSPAQVTVARTNTAGENLNGAWSLEVTKAAADAQGEGLSYSVSVPEGYRGRQLLVSFPFKINSGSLVSGDIKVFAYDVTNSAVITPLNNDIVGTRGLVYGLLSTQTTTATLRIGLHFASTSATAVSFSIDDILLSPTKETIGGITSDWTPYTLVIGAVTTAPTEGAGSTKKAFWRRVGDSMQIIFTYSQSNAGTAGSGTYLFPLPSGYQIDLSKYIVDSTTRSDIVGQFSGGSAGRLGACKPYDATNLFLFGFEPTESGTVIISSAASALSNADVVMSFIAQVPIVGWTSNVSITSSSTIKISHYLASGTRVTGAAPDALGEYRSYLRDAGANTYTETNGSPTATPSVADGIRIYNGNAFGSADTNNEPTRYDIFIGRNKYFRLEWYKSAARTGFIETSPFTFTNDFGYGHSYDPTTGVLSIWGNRVSGGTTTHSSGVDEANTASNDPYFDVIVSENSLAVGINNDVLSPSQPGTLAASARIANNGTATITAQDGAWIASVNRSGAGIVDITLTAGTFTAAPVCTGASVSRSRFIAITATSTSTVTAELTNDSGTSLDGDFHIICVGAR